MSDVTNRSGGTDFNANDVDIDGDVAGRDKVEGNVTHNYYYGAASPQTRHAELPVRRSFFGREAELDEVAKALRPTARTWGVVIDGAGGIGKTALAIEAAYRAPDTDFKSKIFLSAKKQEMTAGGVLNRGDFALTDYLSVLNELAQALGQGELAKSAEKDRARLVARALHDQHTLIILDNLETFGKDDRDRLFTFLEELPGPCKAIVTSRRRDDVGAKAIRLNQLSEDAALKLIDELAQDNDLLRRTSLADRKLLHQTAGGNPLLIKWIAGQVGRTGSRCRTVAQACELLKNAPRDNDPLEFILGDLRETFSDEETALLATLLHFSDLTSVNFIARLADVRDETAEVALDGLANRSLLMADAERRNYALLPVTVTYLRRFLPGELIDQTGQRLMDYVYKLVKDNGYKNYERFKVLDAEWPTIAAALPLFLQGDNARLQTVCDALQSFLDFTGRWDDYLSLSLQARDKAVTAQDFLKAGWRALDAGWIHYRREQPSEVLACAARAEAHWRAAKAGVRETATAIRLRGLGHQLKKTIQQRWRRIAKCCSCGAACLQRVMMSLSR